MNTHPLSRKNGERGFALLLVFLLAAAIALMFYQQMPRVAFEAQRDKEQLLEDRGHQYVRAIQMYFVKYKKYPAKIEDLESTDNIRFLRRRYIDPMTGSKDWRLIHVNGMGQLTDSLVTPLSPSGPSGAGGAASGASGAAGAFTMNNTPAGPSSPPEVNPMVQHRPSDRPIDGGLAGAPNPADVDPNDPRYWPPITLMPSGPSGASGPTMARGAPTFPGIPGQQLPGQQQPGQPGQGLPFPVQQPGQLPIPGMPGIPPPQPGEAPATIPANPTQAGFNPQAPGQQAFPFTPQSPPAQQPGAPSAPPNPALGMINNMLTNPQQNTQTTTIQNNPLLAGGLAGVATTFKGPSIAVYNKQEKYQLWEFIFDLKSLMGQTTPTGQPPQQNGQGVSSPAHP
ncbi:MAG TPA: hypothetical protein VKX39_17800 [Bryobacteraceae bacterium]|jgi:hypothetical protein|nr:hypothetical protein [Bryobacteraceae bacterium]